MTKEQKIQFIRTWCIEANPEHYGDAANNIQWKLPIVRLADVLLAIQATTATKGTTLVNSYGIFMDTYFNMNMKTGWNLRKDDLTEQSDEFITFAYELLK